MTNHKKLIISGTIIGIVAGIFTIMSYFKSPDININITNAPPKELEKDERTTVNATIPNSQKNDADKLGYKEIVVKNTSFSDIETIVKGLASVIFDVKISSISLDTKYSEIDSPGEASLMGVRVIDLLIRLENTYDCKIEDGVAEQLSTIRDTVMLFLSCKKANVRN